MLDTAGPTLPSMQLVLASAAPATASPSQRTISGLIVPFGKAGRTGMGMLTFAKGDVTWSDPRRVKLLREHNQSDVLGYATEIVEREDGIHATFHVPETPAGDVALAEAAHGLRDGLSVGVAVDVDTMRALQAGGSKPVAAKGQLRETSQVSIPAFDDARIGTVAASSTSLVVSSWDTATNPSQEDNRMPETAAVEPVAPAAELATASTTPAASGPVTVQATAGAAAMVRAEPSTYTFDGRGPSIVQDAAAAARGDGEAAGRLSRFNAELAGGNAASHLAVASCAGLATAAVATRSDLEEIVNPEVRRPDLMLNVINAGRPIWSRLNPTSLSNAQPFLVPIEGEFDGVAAHTEGTAHVAEGTMTLDDITVTPRAVSGAYRISRELADSSSPAADRLIVAAMIRDYQRKTEVYARTQLVAGAGSAVTGINTVAELMAQLIDFDDDNGYPADFVLASGTSFTAFATELAADGRPVLPQVNGTNAIGSARPGFTGLELAGTEIVRGRAAMTAGDTLVVATEGIVAAESAVQTFRFEQPEGPGIIKLALFAYQAIKVVRAGAVRRLTLA